MGGGPRTFPGGVSKWQWKRMMVKKREDREERRLEREREVYKMRQRAEVLAAHPELQQPWEKLATFPPPGISAQQHVTGLVNRFHKSSDAEDLWTQRDGPQQNHPKHATVEAMGGTNQRKPLLDAHTNAAMANSDAARQSPATRSRPRGARQHVEKVDTLKEKKDVSSIGKSMQDYLDSFETDPLGLAVDSGTSRSSKEKHRDPLGFAVDNKANTKKRGVGKRRAK